MKWMVLLTILAGTAAAESYSGTVVDVACKDNELQTHPRRCAISCAKSGFGLVQKDGKFLKFDDSGDAKALAALKKSAKSQDLQASVSGTIEGGVLIVDSIKILP